jgi:hypothetical protein
MFIRSAARPFGRSLSPAQARGLVIALYAFYPIGCVLRLVPETADGAIALNTLGLGLVLTAFVAFGLLSGSSLQRQAQEDEPRLDEREVAQRNRAAYQAHFVFSGAALMGLIYLALREDLSASGKLTLWAPTTGDHWSAVFWGSAMLALTLPAAILAFQTSREGVDPDV